MNRLELTDEQILEVAGLLEHLLKVAAMVEGGCLPDGHAAHEILEAAEEIVHESRSSRRPLVCECGTNLARHTGPTSSRIVCRNLVECELNA